MDEINADFLLRLIAEHLLHRQIQSVNVAGLPQWLGLPSLRTNTGGLTLKVSATVGAAAGQASMSATASLAIWRIYGSPSFCETLQRRICFRCTQTGKAAYNASRMPRGAAPARKRMI